MTAKPMTLGAPMTAVGTRVEPQVGATGPLPSTETQQAREACRASRTWPTSAEGMISSGF